jgi:type II pantothenate kinase
MGVPFCKLADPAGYVACAWDLTADRVGREYFVGLFKQRLDAILCPAMSPAAELSDPQKAQNARQCRTELLARLNSFLADPAAFGRITILRLDAWQGEVFNRYGIEDAYLTIKDRENAAALALLPTVCAELDSLSGEAQLMAAIQGLFAGNIFDLGASATAQAFMAAGPDFFQVRKSLRPRPWLIDDFDALAKRMLEGPPHRKAVFFIDNAGGDFVLGATPMMRWLCRRGTRVVLAANQEPALNDMTIADVEHWWPKMVAAEPSLGALPIERVSTGTGEPLIDLSNISEELNTAAADADLVILEGMGRGVESNLHARFSCDAINLAMIKDQAIAQRQGGKVFDLVCRFR